MLNKLLFVGAHQMGDMGFYPTYKKLIDDQRKPYDQLKAEQEARLRAMIRFAYNNVPYYRKSFDAQKVDVDAIKKIEDLEKLPIITKDIIRNNWNDFIPVRLGRFGYYNRSTGGSSGLPLRYRISKYERFLSGAILYRGWSYGGYGLGDRMIFLAGASLGITAKSTLTTKSHEYVRNIRKLSSFDMGQKELQNYAKAFNTFKPEFLYCYPSSIHLFAGWVEENGISIHSPRGIFTTSEKLYPHMRRKISDVFHCDVYDNYGLNDGGVTAFECSEHSGLHIDTERSIMEVVDADGRQIDDGEGRVLATSLHNYAMPFIRYDTGDHVHIIRDACGCGRSTRLLKEVLGRSVDVLLTPEGKHIHGWFFLYIFWDHNKGIREYQVVQEALDRIVIKIVPDADFDERQLEVIRGIIRGKSEAWKVEFKMVDSIPRTSSGKYKFIINNVL